MKTGLVIAIIGLLTMSVHGATVKIIIKNIQSNQGNIRFALFHQNNADKFPSDDSGNAIFLNEATGKKVTGISIPAQVGKVFFAVSLPAGVYAATAYQDENKDEELNKSFFGAPTEPYGFSNDARAVFSAPDFSKAQFELGKQGIQIEFDLL